MTLVQTQPRSANATPADRRVADATESAAPRVGDDMTVEVALSVVISARAGHLLICDDDGLCTRTVTRVQLAAVRDSSAYTDRIRLRDILGDRGPFVSARTPIAPIAGHPTRNRRTGALPVAAGQGGAPGVLDAA
ncbi:CBS domain-containing protein [Streptomyces sp. NPDC055103]